MCTKYNRQQFMSLFSPWLSIHVLCGFFIHKTRHVQSAVGIQVAYNTPSHTYPQTCEKTSTREWDVNLRRPNTESQCKMSNRHKLWQSYIWVDGKICTGFYEAMPTHCRRTHITHLFTHSLAHTTQTHKPTNPRTIKTHETTFLHYGWWLRYSLLEKKNTKNTKISFLRSRKLVFLTQEFKHTKQWRNNNNNKTGISSWIIYVKFIISIWFYVYFSQVDKHGECVALLCSSRNLCIWVCLWSIFFILSLSLSLDGCAYI